MEKHGYIYIMASAPMGTLYIGSTSDLVGRVFEHKNKVYPNSFTAKYNCNILVYYEQIDDMNNMVYRERELKKWNRNWKLRLIIQKNPDWKDLYPEVLEAFGYDHNM
ncbi:MAG: GIY-YIG nuclease family protein [Alphaproteobacteria bacterium]|nr:GIY-YIG nuclease family protein [Alphaproteobacteria bacterium]